MEGGDVGGVEERAGEAVHFEPLLVASELLADGIARGRGGGGGREDALEQGEVIEPVGIDDLGEVARVEGGEGVSEGEGEGGIGEAEGFEPAAGRGRGVNRRGFGELSEALRAVGCGQEVSAGAVDGGAVACLEESDDNAGAGADGEGEVDLGVGDGLGADEEPKGGGGAEASFEAVGAEALAGAVEVEEACGVVGGEAGVGVDGIEEAGELLLAGVGWEGEVAFGELGVDEAFEGELFEDLGAGGFEERGGEVGEGERCAGDGGEGRGGGGLGGVGACGGGWGRAADDVQRDGGGEGEGADEGPMAGCAWCCGHEGKAKRAGVWGVWLAEWRGRGLGGASMAVMGEAHGSRATGVGQPGVGKPAVSDGGGASGAGRVVCPYCGGASALEARCGSCGGLFEPLSRQATQNAMGPWFIRDEGQPFRPGCSYETLVRLAERGVVKPETIVRGPSTYQFWSTARRTPGLANKLGMCHNCQAAVGRGAAGCGACGVSFGVGGDRQVLGLMPTRAIPGPGMSAAVEVGAGAAGGGVGPAMVKAESLPLGAPLMRDIKDEDELEAERVLEQRVRRLEARLARERRGRTVLMAGLLVVGGAAASGWLAYALAGDGGGGDGRRAAEVGERSAAGEAAPSVGDGAESDVGRAREQAPVKPFFPEGAGVEAAAAAVETAAADPVAVDPVSADPAALAVQGLMQSIAGGGDPAALAEQVKKMLAGGQFEAYREMLEDVMKELELGDPNGSP